MRSTPIGLVRLRDTESEALGPPEHRNTADNNIAHRHLDDSDCGCNKPQQKAQALVTLVYKHCYSTFFKETASLRMPPAEHHSEQIRIWPPPNRSHLLTSSVYSAKNGLSRKISQKNKVNIKNFFYPTHFPYSNYRQEGKDT